MAVRQESDTTLDIAIKRAIDASLIDTHTMLPGTIQAFDPDTQQADVVIAIKRVPRSSDANTEPVPFDIPVIKQVPVIFLRGGNFCMTFPVVAGDECLVMFCEREMSNWKANGGSIVPRETRKHDYTDAICLVGLYSQPNKIADFNTDGVEIRNSDNTVNVKFLDDRIEWNTGPVKMTLDSSGLRVDGGIISCEQKIESDVDVTASTISLVSHTHISNGPGVDTEPPTPVPAVKKHE